MSLQSPITLENIAERMANQEEKYFNFSNTIKEYVDTKMKELENSLTTFSYQLENNEVLTNEISTFKSDLNLIKINLQSNASLAKIEKVPIKEEENKDKVEKNEKNEITDKLDIGLIDDRIKESEVIKKLKESTENNLRVLKNNIDFNLRKVNELRLLYDKTNLNDIIKDVCSDVIYDHEEKTREQLSIFEKSLPAIKIENGRFHYEAIKKTKELQEALDDFYIFKKQYFLEMEENAKKYKENNDYFTVTKAEMTKNEKTHNDINEDIKELRKKIVELNGKILHNNISNSISGNSLTQKSSWLNPRKSIMGDALNLSKTPNSPNLNNSSSNIKKDSDTTEALKRGSNFGSANTPKLFSRFSRADSNSGVRFSAFDIGNNDSIKDNYKKFKQQKTLKTPETKIKANETISDNESSSKTNSSLNKSKKSNTSSVEKDNGERKNLIQIITCKENNAKGVIKNLKEDEDRDRKKSTKKSTKKKGDDKIYDQINKIKSNENKNSHKTTNELVAEKLKKKSSKKVSVIFENNPNSENRTIEIIDENNESKDKKNEILNLSDFNKEEKKISNKKLNQTLPPLNKSFDKTYFDEYVVSTEGNNDVKKMATTNTMPNENYKKIEKVKNLSIDFSTKFQLSDYPKRQDVKKSILYNNKGNIKLNSSLGFKPIIIEREGVNYTHNKIVRPVLNYQTNHGIFNTSAIHNNTNKSSSSSRQQKVVETESTPKTRKPNIIDLLSQI